MSEVKMEFQEADLFLEVDNAQYDMAVIEANVRKEIRKTTRAKLEDLKIYVKPEDGKAYYTAKDGSISGSVAL